MAYVVGQAEVEVVPNARGFQADLATQVTPQAQRVGRDVGDLLAKQMADSLSQGIRDGLSDPASTAPATPQGTRAGDAFGAAFQRSVRGALNALPAADVQLDDEAAQAKLDFLREELTSLSKKNIGVDIDDADAIARLTALRAELDNLALRSASVQVNVDTAAASAELDRFFASTAAKADVTGAEVGDKLSRGAASSAGRSSPLIVAAISGGLIAGAPAVIAAGTLLFGGVAAAAVSTLPQVKAAAQDAAQSFTGVFQQAAQQTAPMFIEALGRIGAASQALRPQLDLIFGALRDPIDLVTTGIVNLAHNAMPGLVSIVQNSTPTFQGLSSALGAIGSGVSGFLQEISQHGPAAGQIFASLGQIVKDLLPDLGELVGAGAELASQILPPLASTLHVVSDVLHAIEPILPGIVAGFVGFKVVSSLDGPLLSLATRLGQVSEDGKSATGVLGAMQQSLPLVGLALAAVGFAFEQAQQQVNQWATALNQGGAAAEHAKQQISDTTNAAYLLDHGVQGFTANLTGYGSGLNIAAQAGGRATQSVKDHTAALTPLQAAQEAVTRTQNDYLLAVDKWGASSAQAIGASYQYRDAQDALKRENDLLSAAQSGVSTTTQDNTTRLQGVQTAAQNANTSISLLKDALDALTGKTITADQAQIAVTQSTIAAQHALDGQRDSAGNLTSALVDTNGQINLNTAAGSAAAQALINLAGTQHNEIATLEQQGASNDVVSKKSADLRQQFIDTAKQMGFNSQQAEDLANKYYGIPGQVNTEVTADTAPAQGAINSMLSGYQHVQYTGTAIVVNGRVIANAEGNLLPMAATTASIVQPGTLRVIGDNPVADEAFIPINNSPRSLSILAETASRMGLGLSPMANGGILTDYGTIEALAGQGLLSQINSEAISAVRAYQAQIAAQAAAASAAAGPGNFVGSGPNRALGQQIAAAMGFASQFPSIDYIFTHESGWNNLAQNPTSTAYGIPQFLNSTWAAYGGKTSDPGTQIRDGIRYMVDRYGSPNAAQAFWASHHWYHDGGTVQGRPGANVPAILQAGETVRTARQESALHSGGNLVGLRISGTLDLGDGLTGAIDGRIVDAQRWAGLRASAGSSAAIR